MKRFCENANDVVINVVINRRRVNVVDDDVDNDDDNDNDDDEQLLKRRCEKNVTFIKISFARFRINVRVFNFFFAKFKNVRTIDYTIVKNNLSYEFIIIFTINSTFKTQLILQCSKI